MRVGLGARVREPVNILRATPTDSNTARRAEPRLRSLRALRVSLPWMVLASAQRLRPSDVFGPVVERMRLNVGMPRKKRPAYEPLEVTEYDDFILEIYADDERPNGRGMPGQYKKIETFNLALEILLCAQADAKMGIKKQLFADIRISAVVLERELTKKHGSRHSTQIQQRICRVALRTWGMAGDDQVRLPYVFDSKKKAN